MLSQNHLRLALLALIFLSIPCILYVCYILPGTMVNPNDGSSIDYSDSHKERLVHDWLLEREEARNNYQSGKVKDEEDSNQPLNNHLKPHNQDPHPLSPQKLKVRPFDRKSRDMHIKKGGGKKEGPQSLLFKQKEELDISSDVKCSASSLQECKLYDMQIEAPWDYDCITMEVKPATVICPYQEKQDLFISGQLRREGIWEPHIIKEIQNLLDSDHDFGFIDVGANIGVHTLIAARMGRQVLAIEPFLNHVTRLHKAVKLGDLEDNVTLLQNGVSDRRMLVTMTVNEDNQGASAIESPPRPCGDPSRGKQCPTEAVQTVYLDDIAPYAHFDKAVMKIDIEGHEHRAFKCASKLLSDIYIPYIVMEWVVLRRYYGSEVTRSEDKTLVQIMVDYLHAEGYTAHSLVNGKVMDPLYWYAWEHDVLWKHELSTFV